MGARQVEEVTKENSNLKTKLTPLCKLVDKVRDEVVMELKQGSQFRTGGYIGLASGTIYFGYRSILVYRFGFTAIFYIYK